MLGHPLQAEQGRFVVCLLMAKAGFGHQLSWKHSSFPIIFASFPYSAAREIIDFEKTNTHNYRLLARGTLASALSAR